MGYTRSRIVPGLAIALLAGIASMGTAVQAAAVDNCGGNCQSIGLRVEEYDGETGMSGSCYGACGPGCSINCGGGGACETHDYYMRKHGLWSWQQFSTFPKALVQWGSCVMGRGVDWVPSENINSKVTGGNGGTDQKVSGI